jgi:Fe-S-cluster-containing dehydrogenase component
MELMAEARQIEPAPNDIVMLIDLKKCIGCMSCEVHCKLENDVPMGPRWIRVMQVGPKKVDGRLKTLYIPMLCYHCNPAPCLEACPTNAIRRRAKDGIIYVDSPACIGCKRCMQACPYGAMQWDSRYGRVFKCNFCMNRVDYERKYSEKEIKEINKYLLNGGSKIHSVVYDGTGRVKRDNKGRLLDEKDRPLSGKRLSERKAVKTLEYRGLWSACATKCTTECMSFGRLQDLNPLIKKLGKNRDIKRIGHVYYAIPKDFPFPALEKGWKPKKKKVKAKAPAK